MMKTIPAPDIPIIISALAPESVITIIIKAAIHATKLIFDALAIISAPSCKVTVLINIS